jgi:hypothetical protein
MISPEDDTRVVPSVDEDARWRAYQAWLRQHGNGLSDAVAEPPPIAPRPEAAPRPLDPPTAVGPRGRARIIPVVAMGVVLIGGLSILAMNRGGDPAVANPIATGQLKVQADAAMPASKSKGPQPLPCFVDGQPVGQMTLDDCARRNGVASGKLDVGIDRTPAPAFAAQALPRTLAAAPALARAPLPAPVTVTARRAEPPPTIETAEVPPWTEGPPRPLTVADPQESVRTVRRFYRALAEDDPDSAAALLTPERRGEGAFAAARLGQSEGPQPLHVTEIDPLGPSSVLVRYEVPDAEGDVCVGSAHVETVLRGDRTLVGSVHTAGGC